MITAIAMVTFLVIGDSYCAPAEAWPRQLDASNAAIHVRTDCMEGRFISEYWPSPDMVPGRVTTVVVQGGANDAKWIGTEAIITATQSLIDELVARGYRVIYALPPVIEKKHWSTLALREAAALQLTGAEIVDPPQVERKTDRVHPTERGHAELASFWGAVVFFGGIK